MYSTVTAFHYVSHDRNILFTTVIMNTTIRFEWLAAAADDLQKPLCTRRLWRTSAKIVWSMYSYNVQLNFAHSVGVWSNAGGFVTGNSMKTLL